MSDKPAKKTSKKKTSKKSSTKKKTAKKTSAKKKATKKKSSAKKKATKKKSSAKKKAAKKKSSAKRAGAKDDEAGGGSGTRKGKALVVVESPAKAKTINKFLGKDYLVTASMGHVRDLPKSTLGIRTDDGTFEPTYEPLAEKRKVIADLRKYAKKATTIYLACDMDREGEAIAWHISELLRGQNKDLQRVTFNQITEAAIKKAVHGPMSTHGISMLLSPLGSPEP